jgi:hypothetical protein
VGGGDGWVEGVTGEGSCEFRWNSAGFESESSVLACSPCTPDVEVEAYPHPAPLLNPAPPKLLPPIDGMLTVCVGIGAVRGVATDVNTAGTSSGCHISPIDLTAWSVHDNNKIRRR